MMKSISERHRQVLRTLFAPLLWAECLEERAQHLKQDPQACQYNDRARSAGMSSPEAFLDFVTLKGIHGSIDAFHGCYRDFMSYPFPRVELNLPSTAQTIHCSRNPLCHTKRHLIQDVPWP